MKKMIEISDDVSNETNWRNYMRQLLDMLLEVGLVQTADTGQCVPETHPWGESGYFVLRMNDAMQASLPIYIQLRFTAIGSSGGTIGKVQWNTALGLGSDGVGGVTGQFFNSIVGNRTLSGSSQGVLGAIATDGFFCVFGSYGSRSGPSLAICRTCDSEGVANGFGVTAFSGSSGTLVASGHGNAANLKLGPPNVQTVAGEVDFQLALLKPFGIGQSVSGELPAYLAWHALPEIMPMHGICGVLASSMTKFDTFEIALVGNSPRPYLVLGPNVFDRYSVAEASRADRASIAILWE